jgi:nitrite reductase/ring-hydroxylating ferredoxin subunit
MEENIFIGMSDDFAEGRGYRVMIDEQPYAIYRHKGQLGCISDFCPHQGGRLSQGALDERGCVQCPLHDRRYDFRTGAGMEELVPTREIYEHEGRVYVRPKLVMTDNLIDDLQDI